MNDNEFNINFQRLVAVHYCLSYVVNNVKDGIIRKMKQLVGQLSKNLCTGRDNKIKSNWKIDAVKFFNQFASQNYKNKKHSQENTNKDYTLEDIRNIDDFPNLLNFYNNDKGDGLQLLKIYLNPQFENEYGKAVAVQGQTKDLSLLKWKKTFLDLDAHSVLSFAKYYNKANELLDEYSASQLIKVRNLVAHYLVNNFMDDNLFRYCMKEIRDAVSKNNIRVPFKIISDKDITDTQLNLNNVAKRLYLEATKSAGSHKDLLRYIVRSYGNKSFVQSNDLLDASLEIMKASCKLLDNQKKDLLEEQYKNSFEEVWKLHSQLIGNLKDCIELVVNKTKKKISESFSTSSEQERPKIFKSNAKVAIMAIKALSEKQLERTKKLSFRDLKVLCERSVIDPTAARKRPVKGQRRQKTNTQKQQTKNKELSAEPKVSVENKKQNTQQLQKILDSVDAKMDVANKYNDDRLLGSIIEFKIYDMVKEKFPNHVDHDAIKESIDRIYFDKCFQSFCTVYKNLSAILMIENRINENSKESFESFLVSVESSIDLLLITSQVKAAILELFTEDFISRFLSEKSIYDLLESALEAETEKIFKKIRQKTYYRDLVAEAIERACERVYHAYEDSRKYFGNKNLKRSGQFLLDLERYLTTGSDKKPTEQMNDVVTTVRRVCHHYKNENIVHTELIALFRSECSKFYEQLSRKSEAFKQNGYEDFVKRSWHFSVQNVTDQNFRLAKPDINDDGRNNYFIEEHRLFAMYFYCVIQFERFKQKSYKYKISQAGTFVAFLRYCMTHKNVDIYKSINFQCSDVIGKYGTGNDSLLKRCMTELAESEKYYKEIESNHIVKNDLAKMVVSADRKKKLEEFLSNDLFKMSLSGSFDEAVRNCVLNFETTGNRIRLVAAEENYFEAARVECANIVFEFVKFESEFTSIVKGWLNFFSTTKKNFMCVSKQMSPKDYYKNFKALCRVVAKYAVLKLVNRESDSIKVKEHVELIVATFPYNNKNVNLKELYKDFCVACYGCFHFWMSNPSLLKKFERTYLDATYVEELLTEPILFTEEIDKAKSVERNFEYDVKSKNFRNEKADEVIADVKAYYEANCRLKHLVEDADEISEDADEIFRREWYQRRRNNKNIAQKEEGNQHCLLERMLRGGENFKEREESFIDNLIDERFRKYLISEKFEGIEVAVKHHCYDENVKQENKFLNQLCLRRKCSDFFDQVIHGIESSVWPAVNITNENEKKIFFSLISMLDIFNKENSKSAQNALYGISFNISDGKNIVKIFNQQVVKSFDKIKLKYCLMSLSQMNTNESEIDELVSKKLQPIAIDEYVTEKISNNIKFKKNPKKIKRSPNKAKDKSTNSNNDIINKTAFPTENAKKATSKKRRGGDDVASPENKIIKTSTAEEKHSKDELESVDATEASEVEVKDSDESLQPKTKKNLELDECLKNFKIRSKKINTDLISNYHDEMQVYKQSVKRAESVLKNVKNNLENVRRYKEKLKGGRGIVQENLHRSILNELCEFYFNHVDDSTTEHENYDKVLSSLSTKLAQILQLPDFSSS